MLGKEVFSFTVLLGGLDIVDGAGPADDDEAVVSAIEDGRGGTAGGEDGLASLGGQGNLLLKAGGGEKGANVADAGIGGSLRDGEKIEQFQSVTWLETCAPCWEELCRSGVERGSGNFPCST
jgi:hypothetical protein